MTLQVIVKRICERKLESSMTKSLSEKNDTFGSLEVDVAQLDHAIIVQFSGVARSRYLSTLRPVVAYKRLSCY